MMSKKQEKGFFSRWFFKMQRKLSFEMQLSLNLRNIIMNSLWAIKVTKHQTPFLAILFLSENQKKLWFCVFLFLWVCFEN